MISDQAAAASLLPFPSGPTARMVLMASGDAVAFAVDARIAIQAIMLLIVFILNGESPGDQASGMLNFPGICAKVMAYDQRRHRQVLTQALPELRRIHRFQCSVRDNRVARQSAEREAQARKLWS